MRRQTAPLSTGEDKEATGIHVRGDRDDEAAMEAGARSSVQKNRDPRTNANPCSNTATMRRFGYSHSIVAGGFEEMS